MQGSRLEMQGSTARGSKYKARGSKARHIEYSFLDKNHGDKSCQSVCQTAEKYKQKFFIKK